MSKVHFERQSSTFLLNTDFKQIIDKQDDLEHQRGVFSKYFVQRVTTKNVKGLQKPLLESSQKCIPHQHSPSTKKAAYGVILFMH